MLVASGIDDHDGLVAAVEDQFVWPEKPAKALDYGTELGYVGGVKLLHNDKAVGLITFCSLMRSPRAEPVALLRVGGSFPLHSGCYQRRVGYTLQLRR